MTNDIPGQHEAVMEFAPSAKCEEGPTDTIYPPEARAIETLAELRKRGREWRNRCLNS